MAMLQVRELPDHIYNALREQAKAERRSLAQQAIILIERGLEVSDRRAHRREVLRKIRELDKSPYRDMPDPAKLIREDRDR